MQDPLLYISHSGAAVDPLTDNARPKGGSPVFEHLDFAESLVEHPFYNLTDKERFRLFHTCNFLIAWREGA